MQSARPRAVGALASLALLCLGLWACSAPPPKEPERPAAPAVAAPASAAPAAAAPVAAKEAAAPEGDPFAGLTVTGPHEHGGVAVFLLHAKTQDPREFLTLDESLKAGTVTVTEKQHESVQELVIDNRSDQPLFLQEGDRLRGGNQDRTVHTTMVIPPRSGPMPIPTFCIEQSRWHAGAQGARFEAAGNDALAMKSIRLAAKVDGDQSKVWNQVAQEKKAAEKALAAPNSTSSLNETIDSAEVRKRSDETVAALRGVLDGHPDAVGVAIVLHGKLEEVDVYPGRSLLAKLLPRLIASYAVQAATGDKPAAPPPAPRADEVVKLALEGRANAKKKESVDGANAVEIDDFDAKVRCTTRWNGRPVHHQLMAK